VIFELGHRCSDLQPMLALPSPARRLTARIAQPTTPEKGCVVLHGEPRQGQQWTIDHPQRIFPSPPRAIAPIFPWNPQVRQKTTRTSHFSPLRPVPASLHSHHTYPRNIFVAHHIARMACPHYYCPSLMQLLATTAANQPNRDVSPDSSPMSSPAHLYRPFNQYP
jgi:hypothetical protein